MSLNTENLIGPSKSCLIIVAIEKCYNRFI